MDRMSWMRGAHVLIEDSLKVRPGENVLIVGDSTTFRIVEILAYVAAERGAKVVICVMEPTGRTYAEPPAPVAAAMKAADAILLPVSYSLTHTDARREANAAGARIASLPGVDESVFTGGSLEVDLDKIAATAAKVGQLLKTTQTAEITSANGTAIRLRLAGRDSVDQTGLCHKPGTWGVLPTIETAVGPMEGSTEGTWVLDGVVPQAGLFSIEDPIRIAFSKGRVTSIDGGKEATVLRSFLESFDDPSVYFVVEMGIGLNPKAKMWRSYLEAEAEYGTMHLGIGAGTSFGISHEAPTHCDLVIKEPVLKLDGKIVLRDRTLLVE
jgi:leucyl aminopeptidase (aminopeptidase T)